MAISFRALFQRNDIQQVQPEQEYHVLSCVQTTKMDALWSRKLC